jgi:hypothetical protein
MFLQLQNLYGLVDFQEVHEYSHNSPLHPFRVQQIKVCGAYPSHSPGSLDPGEPSTP